MANSQWLTQVLAAIAALTGLQPGDPAADAQIVLLNKQLATDEGNAAATTLEFQTAISALTTKVAQLIMPPVVGVLPTVTAVTPSAGSVNGGDTFTVTGTGFSVSPPAFNVGAVAATGVAVQSDTSATFVGTAQVAGVYNVTAVTTAGTSTVNTAAAITLA